MANKVEVFEDTGNGYCWKKGLKKFGINALIVILSGLIVVWQDDVKYVGLIPVIKLGLNYLKHR